MCIIFICVCIVIVLCIWGIVLLVKVKRAIDHLMWRTNEREWNQQTKIRLRPDLSPRTPANPRYKELCDGC